MKPNGRFFYKGLGANMTARLMQLLRQPIFWAVTLWGHAIVLGGAGLFYYIEADHNPQVQSFLDALFWSVSTVSSVGSSGIVPLTTHGKILAIIVMISGTLFVWFYTALFVSALLSPEVKNVEQEIWELEQMIKQKRNQL